MLKQEMIDNYEAVVDYFYNLHIASQNDWPYMFITYDQMTDSILFSGSFFYCVKRNNKFYMGDSITGNSWEIYTVIEIVSYFIKDYIYIRNFYKTIFKDI
jgi:hypothetical protein